MPRISTSIWWNCRYRPFCGRSYRNMGPIAHTRSPGTRRSPCSMAARTTLAVHSGRRGQALAVPVVEGIHLLFDDVGHLSDRAPEQLRALHHGRPNLPISIRIEQGAGMALDVLPRRHVVGNDVVHPADGPDRIHGYGLARFESGGRMMLREAVPCNRILCLRSCPGRPPFRFDARTRHLAGHGRAPPTTRRRGAWRRTDRGVRALRCEVWAFSSTPSSVSRNSVTHGSDELLR